MGMHEEINDIFFFPHIYGVNNVVSCRIVSVLVLMSNALLIVFFTFATAVFV